MKRKDAIIGVIKNFVMHHRMVEALGKLNNTDCYDHPDFYHIITFMGFDLDDMSKEQETLIHGIFTKEFPWGRDAGEQASHIYEMLLGVWQFTKPSLSTKQQQLN